MHRHAPHRPAQLRRSTSTCDYLQQVLLELLEIPSPTGRTDHVQQYVGERLAALGMHFSRHPPRRAQRLPARWPAHRRRPGRRGAHRHDRLHGQAAQGERPAGDPADRHAQRPVRRGRPRPDLHRRPGRRDHRHGAAAEGQRAPLQRGGRPPGRRLGARRGPRRRAGRTTKPSCARSASTSATSSRS